MSRNVTKVGAPRRSPAAIASFLLVVIVSGGPLAEKAAAVGTDLFAKGAQLRGSDYDGHTTWSGFGRAIDVNYQSGGDTDCGAPMYAPADGSTEKVSSTTGSINLEWRSADGRERIRTAHLQEVVRVGAVRAGDLIARMGKTGDATTCHAHMARSVNGAPASLELSGRTIVNGTEWTSVGPGGTSARPVLLVDEPARSGNASYWYHRTGTSNGYANDFWWTGSAGNGPVVNSAVWTFSEASGRYRVHAFIPGDHAGARARYEVRTSSGDVLVPIQQSSYFGWVSLGVHNMDSSARVRLTDKTGVDDKGRGLGFDAIRLSPA